jgi:hypothetical protein
VASAYDVFRGGSDLRKDAVKTLWPELYAELAGTVAAAKAGRVVRCASVQHCDTPYDARPLAVGRIELGGGPACKECIADRARRPGGYPLTVTDPRSIR